jgi:hypothetical protein
MFFFLILLIWMHEETHRVIFAEYGCTDVHSWVGFGAFTTANCSGLDEAEANSLQASQANVEAVQYPLMLFLPVLVWGIILLTSQ